MSFRKHVSNAKMVSPLNKNYQEKLLLEVFLQGGEFAILMNHPAVSIWRTFFTKMGLVIINDTLYQISIILKQQML